MADLVPPRHRLAHRTRWLAPGGTRSGDQTQTGEFVVAD
jgi:hypothetical protein